MTAFFLIVVIIRSAIEYIADSGIHFNNQISILALGATADIVLMHFVICHKITDFRFVGANPQTQTVVLVELVLH